MKIEEEEGDTRMILIIIVKFAIYCVVSMLKD